MNHGDFGIPPEGSEYYKVVHSSLVVFAALGLRLKCVLKKWHDEAYLKESEETVYASTASIQSNSCKV